MDDDLAAFRAAALSLIGIKPDLSLEALEAEHARLGERLERFGDCRAPWTSGKSWHQARAAADPRHRDLPCHRQRQASLTHGRQDPARTPVPRRLRRRLRRHLLLRDRALRRHRRRRDRHRGQHPHRHRTGLPHGRRGAGGGPPSSRPTHPAAGGYPGPAVEPPRRAAGHQRLHGISPSASTLPGAADTASWGSCTPTR